MLQTSNLTIKIKKGNTKERDELQKAWYTTLAKMAQIRDNEVSKIMKCIVSNWL